MTHTQGEAPELKPCPFCGGTDIRDTGAPGHYSVQCACFRGGFETRGGARERWNTRQPTAAPSGGMEERVEYLERQLHNTLHKLPKPQEDCERFCYLTIHKHPDGTFTHTTGGALDTREAFNGILGNTVTASDEDVAREIDECVVSLKTMETSPIANAKYLLMPGCKPYRWQMRKVAEAYLNLLRHRQQSAPGGEVLSAYHEKALEKARWIIQRVAFCPEDFEASDVAMTKVLLAHQAAQGKPAEWQPISTAPLNTNVILVSDGQQVWTTWRIEEGGELSCRKYGWKLTHWMPLPTPPSAANGKAQFTRGGSAA